MYGIQPTPVYKDPLSKKFPCNHCGKLLRTRQGLSGHIQFKHGSKYGTKQYTLLIAEKDITHLKIKLKVAGEIIDLPESKIVAILDNWLKVVTICGPIGIDLNKKDFRDYFIAKLADMYQS